MATEEAIDIRAEVVGMLMELVARDRYPSATMMNMIEELATPQEKGQYARILMANVRSGPYPSIPMLRRLTSLH